MILRSLFDPLGVRQTLAMVQRSSDDPERQPRMVVARLVGGHGGGLHTLRAIDANGGASPELGSRHLVAVRAEEQRVIGKEIDGRVVEGPGMHASFTRGWIDADI